MTSSWCFIRQLKTCIYLHTSKWYFSHPSIIKWKGPNPNFYQDGALWDVILYCLAHRVHYNMGTKLSHSQYSEILEPQTSKWLSLFLLHLSETYHIPVGKKKALEESRCTATAVCKKWFESNTNPESDQHYEDSLGHPTLNTGDATLLVHGAMTCGKAATWWWCSDQSLVKTVAILGTKKINLLISSLRRGICVCVCVCVSVPNLHFLAMEN